MVKSQQQFSTVVLIRGTVNKETNIANRTLSIKNSNPLGG